jgi:alkanesulfonate monooxygenase SsuD/methylene tetrahydromethanopterin reductase-like flavin-dependent oxidoreductase (luciferase family)
VAELQHTCRRAEELGAGALWACDHLFWHGPCLEAMTALAVGATATEHATLGTCVMQLPLRQTPEVAKQAATLQSLTRGRFVLGVGVGSHQGEYEQAGVDFHSRGRLLDEGIRELRRSWATGRDLTRGDTAAGGASHYRQLPDPSHVPVWVGGSSEAALRRAAVLGDGWMPLFLSAAGYQQAVERLAKEVDRAGRPPGAVTPSMVLFVSIDDDPTRGRKRGTKWMSSLYGLPAKAFDRHLVAGTAAEVAGVVATFAEAGARHIPVYITDDQPLGQFERLTEALAGAALPTEGRHG